MDISKIKDAKKIIICPGCGWTGGVRDVGSMGECPECGYDNPDRPYRLCTLKEMTAYYGDRYDYVNMGDFLRSLFRVMEGE